MFLYEFNYLIYSHERYHTEYYPLKRKHDNHLFNKRDPIEDPVMFKTSKRVFFVPPLIAWSISKFFRVVGSRITLDD